MLNKGEVKVIGFVTNEVKDSHGPIPSDYLSNAGNLPKALIDELKANGWEDGKGMLWWSPEFQPAPVRGDDGNVYLCISDADTADLERLLARLASATTMLEMPSA